MSRPALLRLTFLCLHVLTRVGNVEVQRCTTRPRHPHKAPTLAPTRGQSVLRCQCFSSAQTTHYELTVSRAGRTSCACISCDHLTVCVRQHNQKRAAQDEFKKGAHRRRMRSRYTFSRKGNTASLSARSSCHSRHSRTRMYVTAEPRQDKHTCVMFLSQVPI